MKTEEGALKDKIKAWLKNRNAYFFMPVQMGYGSTTVDFLCCVNGKFVGVETKAEGKKPTPRQELTIADIRKAGGISFWCDSFESFLINMAALGAIKPSDRDYREPLIASPPTAGNVSWPRRTGC